MTNLAIGLLALFGAGLGASLSPCVAPLVPGYIAVIGRSAGFGWFAGGLVATFAFVGGVVGSVGVHVSAATAGLQRAAGVVLVVFGVLMLLGQTGRGGRMLAARHLTRWLPTSPPLRGIVLGVGCGAAWTPCTGPLLGAALTAAAASGSVWRATLLLSAYALGIVAPLAVVVAIGATALPPTVRRMGRWWSRIAPALMAMVGIALVAGQYRTLVSWW